MASQGKAAVTGNYDETRQNPPSAVRDDVKLTPEGIYGLLDSAGKMHLHAASRNVISARSHPPRPLP